MNLSKKDKFDIGLAAKGNPSIEFSIFDSKRMIGNKYSKCEKFESKWPFSIQKDKRDEIKISIPDFVDPNKMLEFKPEEVSALLLIDTLNYVRSKLGENVQFGTIVVTIPGGFDDNQI